MLEKIMLWCHLIKLDVGCAGTFHQQRRWELSRVRAGPPGEVFSTGKLDAWVPRREGASVNSETHLCNDLLGADQHPSKNTYFRRRGDDHTQR